MSEVIPALPKPAVGLHQPARRVRIEIGELVIPLGEWRNRLVAQTLIDREAVGDAPVILSKRCDAPFADLPGRLSHQQGRLCAEFPIQEVRQVGEGEAAFRAAIGAAAVSQVTIFLAEFEGVASTDIRKIVHELNGDIGALNFGEGATAPQGREALPDDAGEPTIGGQTRTGHRLGVAVEVREIAIIRVRNIVAIARVAELIIAVKPPRASLTTEDVGSHVQCNPVTMDLACVSVPVILRRPIILRGQRIEIGDEVLAGDGVLFIGVVIDLGQAVIESIDTDGVSRVGKGGAV